MTAAAREKRPRRGAGWSEMADPRQTRGAGTLAISAWQKGAVRVLTELCEAELPGGGVGPTWHVSVSRLGRRPRRRDVAHVLRDFDIVGAEQDNHHPGNAQHFFFVVDPALRGICECKATEDVVVEPDGYTWTNPKEYDPEGCRGCEAAAFGRPCPVHPRALEAEP